MALCTELPVYRDTYQLDFGAKSQMVLLKIQFFLTFFAWLLLFQGLFSFDLLKIWDSSPYLKLRTFTLLTFGV